MELRIDINTKVVAWLASMGYPVSGMPIQVLRGMLLREARQWQMSPERLEMMILEDPRQPEHGPAEFASFIRGVPSIPRVRGRMASVPH